jgi:hypothetical protein
MTEERIVRSILLSAASMLWVTGCPPEPPDDADAGIGGSATGGRATAGGTASGGNATGGTASVAVCTTVASLPALGTACSTEGESQCDPSGHQCVCQRQRWFCNTICASTYPTLPTPDSECPAGAACSYPSGVSCACFASRWVCTGSSNCPEDVPSTGTVCPGLVGLACDYPNSDTHMACGCPQNYRDASTGSTWVCATLPPCPATQPAYGETCPGFATCSYGAARCGCWQTGNPWVCGLGGGLWFALVMGDWSPEPPSM